MYACGFFDSFKWNDSVKQFFISNVTKTSLSVHFNVWCGHISVMCIVYMFLLLAFTIHNSQFQFIEFSIICNHFRIVVHRRRSQMKQTSIIWSVCVCVDIVYFYPWLVFLASIVISNMFDISGCIACTYACHYTMHYYIWAQNEQKRHTSPSAIRIGRGLHFFCNDFESQGKLPLGITWIRLMLVFLFRIICSIHCRNKAISIPDSSPSIVIMFEC